MIPSSMQTTTLSSDFQIALPRELCESLALGPGSLVDLSIHDGAIRITPVAKNTSSQPPRPCGLCKGDFTVPDDFNDMDISERRVQPASH
ncbi:MAG: AbrB/MazE/SpoVT family DNA-binding domain-containing protein [Akkermansiaceae bacterium]|nr:AbrB/MazE/SpoVT family DNA-binding domain-containing protein [Akkermansiaceae bacterium]